MASLKSDNLMNRLKKRILIIGIFLLLPAGSRGAQDELRGVWIAWAGNNIPSKESIARMMENVAESNLNTVFVDVWRSGYPYFPSQVYYDYVGSFTDPLVTTDRDVLADMIAEGHRVGLEVHAWLEGGFVICENENDYFYLLYPDLVARRRDGSDLFNDELNYRWLAHANPTGQQFLIDLCQEIALSYDVDGIELDRIRYPELDCGYDAYTVQLYQQEHSGSAPPQNAAASEWMRWRAEKLTAFSASIYDSIKAVRPDIFVSNTPIVYPYGYDNFCQDWRSWINQGHLDFVTPQVYRSSNDLYRSELDAQRSYISDPSKCYPGLTSIANSYLIPSNEIVAMINTTRSRGLQGHVIWYYDTLIDDLPVLRAQVYQEKANIPNRPGNWRRPAIIVHEDDPGVRKSTGWIPYFSNPGFEGGCLSVQNLQDQWIEYSATIAEAGWYEVYCFNLYHWNATPRAQYRIFHANGEERVFVNQNSPGAARWYKLGDFYFGNGEDQKIVRLSSDNIGGNLLFADAVMILNTNRHNSPSIAIDAREDQDGRPRGFRLHQNFPNPFNPMTTIRFDLDAPAHVRMNLFDMQGRQVATLMDERKSIGTHTTYFNNIKLPSGVYLYTLQVGTMNECKKMVIIDSYGR